MSGLVVVGVDGSASSLAAVEVAAREAGLRGAGGRGFGWCMRSSGPRCTCLWGRRRSARRRAG